MKINAADELLKTQVQAVVRPQAQPSKAFADLLNARMADNPTTAPCPTQAPSGLIPLSGVQMTAASFTDPPAALNGTESLLALMDTYRSQLADPSCGLSQASPTVRRMAEALPSLEAACERLPAGDELRQVATQAMVAARLEVMRFARGDYNQ